jgi:protein TonB
VTPSSFSFKTRFPDSLVGSLGVHLALALLVLLATSDGWMTRFQEESLEIELLEKIAESPQAALDLKKPMPPKPEKSIETRQVFGASRKSLTSDNPAVGVEVKAGNTVAKAPDAETLRPEDADSLPIPAEEYLVSQMPVLVGDFRVPYPPEAKKAGIAGAVILDLLIDPSGAVRQVTLVDGPGFGLNEAAVQAAGKLRFKPARIREQAVAVKIRYAYRFVLDG